MEVTREEMYNLVIQGYTIKQLQDHFNCSRSRIADYKRLYSLVGLSPNSKKVDREKGVKTCSTCGIEKPLEEFYSNGKNSSGSIKYKPKCIPCENGVVRDRFYELLVEYQETKNSGYFCEKCGDTDKFGFLEFHHINPLEKDFNIGSISKSISIDTFIETVVPELDKCILLCPNCHKREHILMGLNGIDGTG